jgi:DNA-binding NarL/FixJ family response regulator
VQKSHGRALRVSDSGNQPLLDHHEEAEMPAKRELTMRQLRYMLRLHHDGVSAREIGRTLGVARTTIQDNLCAARRRAKLIGRCRPS